jgi:hypothetical protein
MCRDCNEHMVSRRNMPSVSLLVSSLHTFIHHLVPHSANIHGLTNEKQNLAVDAFMISGPIPRICIDFVKDRSQLLSYEICCQAMVGQLTSHILRKFVLDGVTLDLDAGSHTVFIVRRHEVDNLERVYIEPRSANVENQLKMAINKLQRLEQITLYHTFASINSARAVAGLLFESLGHARLQEGITLTLRPAIKRKGRKYFHRNFQREDSASNSMDLDGPEPVFFPPNTRIVYEELRSVEPYRLHIPKARNQIAHSFFILGQFLYLFQFTMANNHDIKKGIEESLSSLVNILPPKTNWRFVFISPPGCDVDVKADSAVEKFLEGVTLYSAHLNIEGAPEAPSWRNFKLPLLSGWATAAAISWFSRMFFSPNGQ